MFSEIQTYWFIPVLTLTCLVFKTMNASTTATIGTIYKTTGTITTTSYPVTSTGLTTQNKLISQNSYTTATEKKSGNTVTVSPLSNKTTPGDIASTVSQLSNTTTPGDISSTVSQESGKTTQNDISSTVSQVSTETRQGDTSYSVSPLSGKTAQGDIASTVTPMSSKTTQGYTSSTVSQVLRKTTQGDIASTVSQESGKTTQDDISSTVSQVSSETTQGHTSSSVSPLSGKTTQKDIASTVTPMSGKTTQGYTSSTVSQVSGKTTQGDITSMVSLVPGKTTQGDTSSSVSQVSSKTSSGITSTVSFMSGETTTNKLATVSSFSYQSISEETSMVSTVSNYTESDTSSPVSPVSDITYSTLSNKTTSDTVSTVSSGSTSHISSVTTVIQSMTTTKQTLTPPSIMEPNYGVLLAFEFNIYFTLFNPSILDDPSNKNDLTTNLSNALKEEYEKLPGFRSITVTKLCKDRCLRKRKKRDNSGSAEANVLFSGKPYSDNSSFKEPMEFVENFTDTTNVTLKRIHETSFIKYVDESRTLNDARASAQKSANENKICLPSHYFENKICKSWCKKNITCNNGGYCIYQATGVICQCRYDEKYSYSGTRCEIKTEKLGLESKYIIAVSTGIGGAFLIIIGILTYLCVKEKRKTKNSDDDNQDLSDDNFELNNDPIVLTDDLITTQDWRYSLTNNYTRLFTTKTTHADSIDVSVHNPVFNSDLIDGPEYNSVEKYKIPTEYKLPRPQLKINIR